MKQDWELQDPLSELLAVMKEMPSRQRADDAVNKELDSLVGAIKNTTRLVQVALLRSKIREAKEAIAGWESDIEYWTGVPVHA